MPKTEQQDAAVETYKGIDRKQMVRAVKNMNEVLGFDPPIGTKGIEMKQVAKALCKYARGWDESTDTFEDKNAITREDKLAPETFDVLEAFGAIPPVKKDKVEKAEKVDKPGRKSAKELVEAGTKEKVAKPRTLGAFLRAKTWKEAKAFIVENASKKGCTLAIRMDNLLLEKHTYAELEAEAAKFDWPYTVASHIAYRYGQGYDFKDTRDTDQDPEGVVQMIGFNPENRGRKLDIAKTPTKAALKQAEREARKAEKAAAEKAEKKAKKAAKNEEPPAKPAKAKKAKTDDDEE